MRALPAVMATCLFIGTAGCARSVRAPVAPSMSPGPSLSVESSGDCVDRAAVIREIDAVLTKLDTRHSGLQIAVTAQAGEDSTLAALTVVRGDGQIGLSRQYAFAKADCESVPALLATTVQRFLTAFPAWVGPPRVVKTDQPIRAQWHLLLAANVEGLAHGANGELETSLDVGKDAHRVGISALWRVASQQNLGANRFYYMTVAAGFLWRRQGRSWHPRAELRVGRTRVRGLGFLQNTVGWLPALEAVVALERTVGPVRVGMQLSASPLVQHAVTLDGRFRQQIPWFRFGVVVVVPLWSQVH